MRYFPYLETYITCAFDVYLMNNDTFSNEPNLQVTNYLNMEIVIFYHALCFMGNSGCRKLCNIHPDS